MLDALKDQLLDPVAVPEGVRRAVAELTAASSDTHADALADRVQQVERELRRLSEQMATADSASLPELLAQMRTWTEMLKELRDQQARPTLAVTVSERALTRELEARVQEWRSLLTANPDESRALVRRLLIGRLAMTAQPEGYYTFTGTGTLENLVEGVVPQSMASPPGFEPGFQP